MEDLASGISVPFAKAYALVLNIYITCQKFHGCYG